MVNNERQNMTQKEVFTKRVPAGKRTYFFDVRATVSGKDFFVVITESRRTGENENHKQRIFLYKEDFEKFCAGLAQAIDVVKEQIDEMA
jgi:hypothetical protein